MKRRSAFVLLGQACLGLMLALAGAGSAAQRPSHPIVRPPRPGGAIAFGHFPNASDGVNRAQSPGIYVVRAVNDRDNIVQLSDADGRVESVYVRPEAFDISDLKLGDEVVVDFVVQSGSGSRLEAANLWPR